MRLLQINDENKAKAQKLHDYAKQPGHWFWIPEDLHQGFIPGEHDEYVVHIDTYRCVFTYTRQEDKLLRHLTVSVPTEGKLPNPLVAFTIATWFGYTGARVEEGVARQPGRDWVIGAEGSLCITIMQEIEEWMSNSKHGPLRSSRN